MTPTDKIQAIINAELQTAYARGVRDGLRHFDRLHIWTNMKSPARVTLRQWADQEAKRVAKKYPELS